MVPGSCGVGGFSDCSGSVGGCGMLGGGLRLHHIQKGNKMQRSSKMEMMNKKALISYPLCSIIPYILRKKYNINHKIVELN